MIFDGMIRHLDAKKKFLMYPRFIQVFLNNQLSNITVPLEHLPTPVLTKKVFSFMIKQGLNFSSKITLLFLSILTQATVEECEDSETPTESQPTPSPTQPSAGDQPLLTESSSNQDTSQDPRVKLEGISGSEGDQVQLPHDSPLSGSHTSNRAEGSLNLEELSTLCTNLSKMVLALETVSKQERKNAKSGPTKDDSAKLDAKLDEDMEYIDTEEGVNEGRQITVDTARPNVSTARPDDDTTRPDVSTARQEVSIIGPTTPPTTTTIFDDEEMTLADTLIKLKDDKAKGVAFKDSEDKNRPARSIIPLKPLPIIDPKDKGNGVLKEPESAKKMTKSDFDAAQIARDEEIARQLEVDLQAEVERERQREEQASMNYIENLYGEVQARTDADHELAVILTHKEQEKYTVVERATLSAEYFERRQKQLAEEKVDAIRNKPLTKTQLRRLMMTYLKNMGRFTHSQLNKKSFEDIQGLYMKEHELIADFVPIGSEEDERTIRDTNKKAEKESTDKEEKKLKTFLKIDPDEEGIIDYEVLDKRFPIINWESKFYYYGRHGAEGIYYRIFKSDGSSRWIKTFSKMVRRFDRLDLVELYNLVMQRFETTTPEDSTEIHMLVERRLMNLEAMIEERRIFKYWFYHHTTNGHQFTMSNKHQELASPEANNFCKELASPNQTALGKDISNPLIVDSLLKTIWLSMHPVIAMKHWLFQSKRLLYKLVFA
uniref:Uncharacterized protein n=1 Tax=Tanacetum cinerariifolium TaxID=118510 RepID=A0A6L2J5X6_TANCI|nr:hypothetical protein [Tanacetum cinerariifolium]